MVFQIAQDGVIIQIIPSFFLYYISIIVKNQVKERHQTNQLIQQSVKDYGRKNGIQLDVKMNVVTKHITLIIVDVNGLMMGILLMEVIM
jgi:hypothetical protein